VVVECDDLKIVWIPITVLSVLVLDLCDAGVQLSGLAMGVWRRTDAPVHSHQYSCGVLYYWTLGLWGPAASFDTSGSWRRVQTVANTDKVLIPIIILCFISLSLLLCYGRSAGSETINVDHLTFMRANMFNATDNRCLKW